MLQRPLSQGENLSAYREDRHPHLRAERRPRPILLLIVRPFFLAPKRNEVLGLTREHRTFAVVPNHVGGFFDFFFERHLGFDHRFRGSALDLHSPHEIGELDVGRTRDHDHSVAQGFTTGFIKKWNVCEEKFGSFAVSIRFNAPLPANPRMENLFERAFFGLVLENYRAECLPIQVAIGQENSGSELSAERFFNLLKIDKLASDRIGIEKFSVGKNLAETLTK